MFWTFGEILPWWINNITSEWHQRITVLQTWKQKCYKIITIYKVKINLSQLFLLGNIKQTHPHPSVTLWKRKFDPHQGDSRQTYQIISTRQHKATSSSSSITLRKRNSDPQQGWLKAVVSKPLSLGNFHQPHKITPAPLFLLTCKPTRVAWALKHKDSW